MNLPKNIEEVKYNSPYYWNVSLNPLATIENGLGNCTTLVIGAVLSAKLPMPISKLTDAGKWHKYLTNGWVAVPYQEYKANIKVGDIVEWESGNHVAIVSNIDSQVWISGSFYTGINGASYINGKYDTRKGINSLKELSDFMLANYEYRYFHYVPLETECKWCNGLPTYVLVSPNAITPVDKNNALDQVYVGTNGLRVRTEPNTNAVINGYASIGYYNVSEVVTGGEYENGNTWYKIGDYYIAGVDGVFYYPKENLTPADEIMKLFKQMQDNCNALYDENKELKERLERIKEYANSRN